jgi:gliding motility-associated protein GldM
MAHGKETPRQKMIGMMYLVLTALLALNVAAEVLNAFSLIDNSLRKTTENTYSKSGEIYSKFEAAMQENPIATKEWKDIADKVKKETQQLIVFVDTLKFKIVRTVEGPQGDPNNIQKKDDINVPGQIMITEKESGKNRATILKEKIDAYREFLIKIIKDPKADAGIIDGFKSNLNTDDVIGQEKNKVPWTVANFDQLPMAGVIALMSKMQADIRNAESAMLSYLYSNIGGTDFKFNKIEAIVTAPSNYVLMNQPFKANVFIAASDSTTTPIIKLDGGTLLPIENGKGVYTGATGSPGPKTFGGVIELKQPKTGKILTFPFKSEYTVGQASLVVSPTKMNVFYIGVDNPVDVSVPGVPPSKVSPFVSGGGSISRSGNGWVVRVKGPAGGKVQVGATAEMDGQKKNMGSKEFRVKRVPDPLPKVGGSRGGKVDKAWLSAQTGVRADLENFDFDLTFPVASFNVSCVLKGGFAEDARSSGATFTAQQVNLIRQVQSGKKVYIEDVMAKSPDGTIRNIGSITFTVR